ncbi:MAG: alpha/beta fold hydrolase [Arenimonas sp.]
MKSLLKKTFKYLGMLFLLAFVAVAIISFKPIPATIKPIQANPQTHYWKIEGAYRIAYQKVSTGNSAALAPVIFLHGGPGGYIHSEIIKTLSPLSASGRDVYFYDQSGTGLSDRRAYPKDTTLLGHVEDLHEIITQHLKARKVVLIGHSYGGQLASGFAARYPELIEKLVLSSPGAIMPGEYNEEGKPLNDLRYQAPANLVFRTADPNNESRAKEDIDAMPVRAIVSLMIATVFNRKFAPDSEVDNTLNTMASHFTEHMVCDPKNVKPEEGGGGMYSRIGSNFYQDSDNPRPLMPKMQAPVLVLQGGCDFIAYGDAYEYVALFPNARYQFIPDAGHIIWWDKPEVYRNEIRKFLAQPLP